MAAKAGRNVIVYYTPPGATEEVALGALKSKSVTINNEPIDITTDDDSGYRTLLSDAGSMRSADLKLSGLLKDRVFLEYVDQQALLAIRIVFPGATTLGVQITGNFWVTSTELGAEMEDAATVDYSFQSSGTFSIEAVSP